MERLSLINVLCHVFTEDYLPSILKKYRHDMISLPSQLSPDLPSIISDSDSHIDYNNYDVNRIFGWSIYKERKKCIALTRQGKTNAVNEGKLDILNDMRVFIIDVINDAYYINLYIPTDDLVRNRGYMTLISPKFVRDFAYLLGSIQNKLNYGGNSDSFRLPDKEKINKELIYNDAESDNKQVGHNIKNLERIVMARLNII